MESFLQTAWGDQWDNVTIDIVHIAIKHLRQMDDKHGAFWVSVFKNEESTLEIRKNLEVIGSFEDDPKVEHRNKLKDWNEVESLFLLLLEGKFNEVRTSLTSKY